jgi:hypothetical protein
VTVRVQRAAIQVIAKAPATAALHRAAAEGAFLDDGSGGTVRVQRAAVQVLAKAPATARAHRVAAEGAFLDAGTGGVVRVPRAAAHVLAKVPPRAGLQRISAEAGFLDAGTGGVVRVQRAAVQVIGRAGIPKVQPLAFPTGLDWFLHNWTDGLKMETAYSTDVSRSPTTLAEERRALVQRPSRLLTVSWLRDSTAETDRLLTRLRRLTKDRTVAPLYQDTIAVAATPQLVSGSPSFDLNCTTTYRRFHEGARVAVFPARGTYFGTDEVDVYTIRSVRADRITMTTAMARTYNVREWLVVPLMDSEQVLAPEVRILTTDTAQTTVDIPEVHGRNSLPPIASGGVPAGWQVQLGLPVFEVPLDWAGGIRTSYQRYGFVQPAGRITSVVADGDDYVQLQQFRVIADRAEFWRILSMFDSRRGQVGTFLEIDQEALWTVADTDPQFVDVSPLGDFDEFKDSFRGYLGFVMKDGTVIVREVNTVVDNGSAWRITIGAGPDLPDIDVTQIARFSRARRKRFADDALTETWQTTEVCELNFATIEVVNEKEVDVG